MNRSVRNGLAIAGMAGGMLFLGQAVANADQNAEATSAAGQVITNEGSSGDNGSVNAGQSSASATNVQEVDVATDVDGGDVADNDIDVTNGINPGYSGPAVLSENKGSEDSTKVTATTGDVHVTQTNAGGDVTDSGNANVSDLGDQNAEANSEVTQAITNDDDGKDHEDGENKSANLGSSDADAKNVQDIEVDTDIDGGDVVDNDITVDNGIHGNTFHCPSGSTCHYNFTTGDVTITQTNTGGDVNGSGNVNVGDGTWGHPHADHHKPGMQHGDHHAADCPDHKPAAAPAHHVKRAAPVAHRAAMNPTAQPTGQLAYTGAETTAPLTLGLLALGAGGALTLAGRRRSSTATV